MQCYKNYGNYYEYIYIYTYIYNVIPKYSLNKLIEVPLFTLCEVVRRYLA